MKVKATYREIWNISYPIMLGSIAQTFIGITDTAYLARVGEVELGASAIGGVFYFVLVMMGMGLGIGAQILMARKAGENNVPAIGRIFDHSLLILLFLSVFLFFTVYLFSPFLFSRIIHSPMILPAAVTFIKFRIGGIFFIMVSIAFRAFYTGIAQTRIITYSALVMAGLNVLLAWVFIFGHFGFPAMGIGGAALASSISEAAAAVYLAVYTLFKRDIKKFNLFTFKNINGKTFGHIIDLSTPIVLQNIISMGAWFAFFIFIEGLGEHALAISNIVRSNYMILMTPVWGFSSAASSMVSNLIGQKKGDLVFELLKKIILLSLVTAIILVAFNLVFAKFMLHLTASDEMLTIDALPSFYIVCVATLVFSCSMILFSAVSGTGATKAAMLLEFSNISIYLLFVYVCASVLHTRVEVVWFAEVLYWLMMGLFSFYYLRSKRWIHLSI